jgi:hypothetical protein
MNQSTSTNAGQSGINESQPPATSGHGVSARASLRGARLLPPAQTIAERLLQHNRRVVALVVAASYGNDAEVGRLLDDPQAEPFLDSILDAAAREATAAGLDDLGDEMGTLNRPDRFEMV